MTEYQVSIPVGPGFHRVVRKLTTGLWAFRLFKEWASGVVEITSEPSSSNSKERIHALRQAKLSTLGVMVRLSDLSENRFNAFSSPLADNMSCSYSQRVPSD